MIYPWLIGHLLLSMVLQETADTLPDEVITMTVTATAYNSVPSQTQGDPTITAWGDKLEPGMRVIAVSRDLIELGLTHKTQVAIEGLDGDYLVLDKMAARWTRKIDIYMGNDIKAARQWGKQEVTISWKKTE